MPTIEIADWCPMDLAADVVAPYRATGINDRLSIELQQVVAQFEAQGRYTKRDVTGDGIDETFCNFFVRDVLAALGVMVPRLRANDLCDWLAVSEDWTGISEWVGRDLVKVGRPVIAAWKNPAPKRSGHVALLVPSKNELDRDTTFIAQAGISNFIYGRLEAGFGTFKPLFYAHR